MAFWNRPTQLREAHQLVREALPANTPTAAAAIPTWQEFSGLSEQLAMTVPAINRGVKLISGTVAQLPLTQWRDSQLVEGSGLLRQPEPDRAAWASIQATVRDLVLHGRAYWQVRDLVNSHPSKVKVLPAAEVSQPENDPDAVRYQGQRLMKSLPSSGPGSYLDRVICFEGFRGGILETGAQTILTAVALELAVRRYAEVPLPSFALRNTGADLPDEAVQELLDAWESARQTRATAYLSSAVEAQAFGWSSADLQLTEARNEAAIQCARLLNLDPHWLAASVAGTSLTYSNRIDLRQDLIDLTLSDYMLPIEQRLTMRDVTPTQSQNLVAFDTTEFLRGSLADRVALVAQLMPTGVITADEARHFLTFAPGERTPLA
jgi:phage portal protein BeeE